MGTKRLSQTVAYKALYSIVYGLSLLPMVVLYSVASIIFFFAYYVGYRKAVVIQNIARSFPEKRYGEIQAIVKKFYACFAVYFAEIIKAISAPTTVLEKKIVFENLELIDQHINSNRNIIACLGHCGNWEMLNIMPSKLRHRVYAVYKPLKSGAMNAVMAKIRARFGMELISEGSVVRHMLSDKSKSSVYLFLADQYPSIKDEKYRLTFLNQETYVFSGMEKLARKCEAAVIYLHITQPSKGHYKVVCTPVCSKAETTSDGEITQKYMGLLSENIHEEPYGWLWTHKRWKG